MTTTLKFDRETIIKNNGIKYEGYWAQSAEEESIFPFPVGSDSAWPGKEQFLAKMRERENKAEGIGYRGPSFCRLAGKHGCDLEWNGNVEYVVESANGDEIHWPEGFYHYIEVHNVKPSKEFYNFIMS